MMPLFSRTWTLTGRSLRPSETKILCPGFSRRLCEESATAVSGRAGRWPAAVTIPPAGRFAEGRSFPAGWKPRAATGTRRASDCSLVITVTLAVIPGISDRSALSSSTMAV